jgi:predicted ATPase/transcriptional regulator with XRE-family HTH domain
MAAIGPSPFASLVRHYRRRNGLTQEELAERAGLSSSAVSQLERGLTQAPHKDTIQLLITALALSTDDAAVLAQAARRLRAIPGDLASTAPADAPADALSDMSGAPPPAAALPSAHAASVMPSYRLATPLTPLLGREHDEASAAHLLAQERVRLLTLTGPAGVGKTRLALQVAATLREREGFDLTLVDLVAAPSADQAPHAIAQALGVRETGDLSLLDALSAAIGGRRLLLVLDNFEHVLPSAPFCVALLSACPHAKALVTSRAALNIRGEHEFAVPPLRVPDLAELGELGDFGEAASLANIERYSAVALFVERARAAQSDFALRTPARGRLVAAICAQLDGLPLAIELAAAQMRHFTLADLATRLQGAAPLNLLVGGPRDLADHQRAMRSTIAWSYGLLSPDEQRVFRALGVFAGGATVEGARVVAGLGEELVAGGLQSLVEASLAFRTDQPSEQSDETRYDLLVIVRAFAVERLREAGELESARRRLADYVVQLVDQLGPAPTNVQTAPLSRLMREHDDLRAVLDWLLESGELATGLHLAARLRTFWESRGLAAEGAEWLERLLTQVTHAEPSHASHAANELDAQVDAWKALVVMRHRQGRFQQAAEAADRVLALARKQDDAAKIGQALHYLANPLAQLGEFDRAEALLLESLAINRAAGDKTAEMIDYINLGELRSLQSRYEEALASQQEALTLSRSLAEQEPSLGLILANLGETYLLMDRPAAARDFLLESQRVFEAREERTTLGLYNLGRACWRLGSASEALEYLKRATRLSCRQDDMVALVQELCVVAGVTLGRGDLTSARLALDEASIAQARVTDQRVRWRVVERVASYVCRCGAWEVAARLYAAAARARSRTRDPVDPIERELRARDRAAMLHALGPDAVCAAEQTGSALTLPHALKLARAVYIETCPE